MVPIIGLDNTAGEGEQELSPRPSVLGGESTFAATQPDRLVCQKVEADWPPDGSIVSWELELFDTQAAQLGGLDKEFIFAGRIDDKLCSWSALEALIASTGSGKGQGLEQKQEQEQEQDDKILKVVGLYDDEEIGSLLRQGAHSNLLSNVIERACEAFATSSGTAALVSQTYANSFLVSSDVTHAVNPNFLGSYLERHAPRLNTGICISYDSNGHVTTDAVSAAVLQRVAARCGACLQVFQIRNDSRSGGTVGPMLSSKTGMRAVDAGSPQLSMHSIRATTGSLDPGLGVQLFKGFFDYFEEVDREFV